MRNSRRLIGFGTNGDLPTADQVKMNLEAVAEYRLHPFGRLPQNVKQGMQVHMAVITYPESKCYICNGRKVIAVSIRDDDGDETFEDRTCVRCGGKGVLTDGFGLEQIPEVREPLWPSQTCICEYERDGPMGHPKCPAR